MQSIQLQSFFHEKNDAADSTAFFFFHSGGAWAERPQAAPPRMKKLRKTKPMAKKLFFNIEVNLLKKASQPPQPPQN